tara:strand:- start:180 stop:1304 length:1125 start_codon:yes stop_codon:yes gene_type:complete
MDKKKIIIISAINITNGGPHRILNECLDYSISLLNKYKIFVLINNTKVVEKFNEYNKLINFVEFPLSKKSWIFRVFYEYFYFKFFSRKYNVDIWFSLHDCSPFVKAKKQFVYCHNTDIFAKIRKNYFFQDPIFILRKIFYRFVYSINISSNHSVIVQQDWMRKEFYKKFKVKNIIVAQPNIKNSNIFEDVISKPFNKKNEKIFFYPVYPRCFKNHEIICEALNILEKEYSWKNKVIFTIKGDENKYAKWLWNKYKHLKSLEWKGVLQPKENYQIFKRINFLLFTSTNESWGLPITEAKSLNIPIIVSDLPYAKETVGHYGKVNFIDPDNPVKLADLMFSISKDEKISKTSSPKKILEPVAYNWKELFEYICEDI